MIRLALSAFILTTAPAMAIDIERHVQAVVNMQTAQRYCGLKTPVELAVAMVMDVAQETGVNELQLTLRINDKAEKSLRNASSIEIENFCRGMKYRYSQIGIYFND